MGRYMCLRHTVGRCESVEPDCTDGPSVDQAIPVACTLQNNHARNLLIQVATMANGLQTAQPFVETCINIGDMTLLAKFRENQHRPDGIADGSRTQEMTRNF